MLTITDELLQTTHMTEAELRQELAVYLYAQKKLSFGQAQKLAGLDVLQFQELLFRSKVDLHYGVSDLMEDYESVKKHNLK